MPFTLPSFPLHQPQPVTRRIVDVLTQPQVALDGERPCFVMRKGCKAVSGPRPTRPVLTRGSSMDSRALLVLRWASQLLVRVPVRRAHQMRRTAALVSSLSRGRVRTLGGLVGAGRDPLPLPSRLRTVNRRRLGRVPRTGGYVNRAVGSGAGAGRLTRFIGTFSLALYGGRIFTGASPFHAMLAPSDPATPP